MVIQAIGLLDDLDKELNTYAMRVREWYGWHYPEMAKIITDNIKYAKVVSHQQFCLLRLRRCLGHVCSRHHKLPDSPQDLVCAMPVHADSCPTMSHQAGEHASSDIQCVEIPI